MQVLLKLFNMVDRAADNSKISRAVTEAYLASSDYRLIIQDRLALGGVTHKDRVVDNQYEDVIAPDDQIMVSENVTHYIRKIFTKPDDPFCYAVIEVLNPDDYSGKRRENIMNLIADLKSGIKLPCSVVIQAVWSPSDEAEEIIRIKGVDFTLGPSFEGSGTVKILTGKEKSFSKTNKKSREALGLFSFNAEVMNVKEIRRYSLKEIGRKYGLASRYYSEAKKFNGLTEEQIEDIHDGLTDTMKDNLEIMSTEDFKTFKSAVDEILGYEDVPLTIDLYAINRELITNTLNENAEGIIKVA